MTILFLFTVATLAALALEEGTACPSIPSELEFGTCCEVFSRTIQVGKVENPTSTFCEGSWVLEKKHSTCKKEKEKRKEVLLVRTSLETCKQVTFFVILTIPWDLGTFVSLVLSFERSFQPPPLQK